MSWFVEIAVPGVDPALPGLYEWRIAGVGCYIGQYTRSKRPRVEYALNDDRILNERPYRKNNPDGFRTIHKKMAEVARQHPVAGESKPVVTLRLIENVIDKSERNKREQELIAQRRREECQGGLPVLNASPRTPRSASARLP